jgi:Bacterial protein of unknown function (DUF839)
MKHRTQQQQLSAQSSNNSPSTSMMKMTMMMFVVMIVICSNNTFVVTAFSRKSYTTNLFRCDNATDSTQRCYYGLYTIMHHYNTTTNVCIESCVLMTGLKSSNKYFCGTCPTDSTGKNYQPITYEPGNLIVEENGLILSAGLTAKVIATKDQPVTYSDGTTSDLLFHRYPDAGATFIDPRPNNVGGWIYVSNSEYRYKFDNQPNLGGVGAVTFDKNGNIIEYNKILYNTTANCAGGKTPWNTWVSCEEYEDVGTCYEVDPTGGYYTIPSSIEQNTYPNNPIPTGGYNITASNLHRGEYESFAYDIINPQQPRFYVTKDEESGELRRFTPSTILSDTKVEDWNETNFLNENNPHYFTLLQNEGIVDYLVVEPDVNDPNRGTFYWTEDYTLGSTNAKLYHPNVEGIDVVNHTLYFISKIIYSMFILNLQDMTYQNVTTMSGLFDGQSDQVDIVLHDSTTTSRWPKQQSYSTLRNHMLLYFTEDTNRTAGIHGRNALGEYVTILQSTVYNDETTGFAFSPNFQHFYFAYQGEGILFQISRTDQYPFYGSTLNVKYHGDTPE